MQLDNPSIEKLYRPRILEAVHARRFDDALRIVTERNDQIWAQRGGTHGTNFKKWQRIADVFTKDLLRQKSGLSEAGDGLIFIVGMPRSGKSTLENFLGEIPRVKAADELTFLSDRFHKLQDPSGQAWDYPDYVPVLPDQVWAQFGESYASEVKALYKDHDYIIDTLPPNFRYIGLIRIMLPKAKIIYMQRNPMDHIIDMFSKVFKKGWYDYTYNWGALTEFYVAYRHLMAHWDDVIEDGVLKVAFEDLMSNPKKELKRVIDFCNIETDISPKKLIAPHQEMIAEINHAIATLKNYHPHLKDLAKQLGPYKRL